MLNGIGGSSQHAIAVATTIAATSSGGQNGRERRTENGGDDAERDRALRDSHGAVPGECLPASWSVPCGAGRLCGDRSAFRSSAARSDAFGRAADRSRAQRRGGDEAAREPLRSVASGGAPAWMELRALPNGHSPEGMPIGERLHAEVT